MTASMTALALSARCSTGNERFPAGAWMFPAVSTRHSTLPSLGSTPSRKDMSTDSSNFAAGMSFRTARASSMAYGLSVSIFACAASYRLLTVTVAMSISLNDVDAHAAGRAFDDAHRRVDRLGVQIDELGLGDLPDLLARDLADLVLVGHGGGLRDP